MKRILIVSIAAPPKSGPESLQVGKYIKELSKEFILDLVTTKSSTYGWNKNYGLSINSYRDLFDQVIELPGFSNRFWSKVKSFLPDKFAFPDANFHFHYFSQRVLQKLNNKPDLIYSRSTPFSSAILAYKLSRALAKPWIMHMSDPWSINPELKNKKRHEKWEKKCIEKADLISVTNLNYLNYLISKYPQISEKLFLSYNAFSETHESKQQNNKLIMAYFGNFYANRNPFGLLNVLHDLYNSDKTLFDNFEIRMYGNRSTELDLEILDYKLPFVSLYDAIPSQKIPLVLNEITMFLNFEDISVIEGSVMTLPSKVIDYISYQKPILSITSRLSPSVNLIEGKYGYVFAPNQKNELSAFFKKAIIAFNDSNSDFFKINKPSIDYSITTQVSVLSEKIEILTRKAG